MAGIVGVWDPDADHRERAFQSLVADAHCGLEFNVSEYKTGEISCATILKPGSHPNIIHSQDARSTLLIQGEILDLPDDQQGSDRFLNGLVKDPVVTLDACDGAYAGALIEHESNTITLFADQFANLTLHYYWFEGRILFSTQATALARVLNAPANETDVIEYLTASQNFGSRTIFGAIHRVRAGEIVRLSPKARSTHFFARPDYASKQPEASTNELAVALCEGLVKRVKGKRVAAGLSGGMDTRLMWSAILATNSEVTAHSHGSPRSRDLLIGKAISRKLGIPNRDLLFDDEFVENSAQNAEQLVRLSEGGMRLQDCFVLDIWKHLGKEHDLMLDGHGGALYSRQIMKSVGIRVRSLEDLAVAWRPRLLSALIDSNFLRRDVKEAALENLQRTLLSELHKYNGTGGIQAIIDIFYIRDLGTRTALSGNAQLNFMGLHHPLMTRDLTKLAERVPISRKLPHGIHRAVINRLAPELARFLVDNDGLPATFVALPLTRIPPILYERLLRKYASIATYRRFTLLRPTNTAVQMLLPQKQKLRLRIASLPTKLTALLTTDAQPELLQALDNGDGRSLLIASSLANASILIEAGKRS